MKKELACSVNNNKTQINKVRIANSTFLLPEELFSIFSALIESPFSFPEDFDLFFSFSFSFKRGESEGLSLLLCFEEPAKNTTESCNSQQIKA